MTREIKIGSIIHLENKFTNGGFLETRGSISDIPVITKFPYTHGRSFVFTHEKNDRFRGSGSWEIISVNGARKSGDPLASGDEIYLLNKHTGAGYLDTFEWVRNLEPFEDYPMTIGVFTASVPDRGGGLSGTWIVELMNGDKVASSGKKISAGDTIRLKNKYPSAGYLHTWEEVTHHPLVVNGVHPFHAYDGQRLFVFTSDSAPSGEGSNKWTITLSSADSSAPPSDQTELTNYYIWRDLNGTWVDAGVFSLSHPIVVLNVTSGDMGATLSGEVAYVGKEIEKVVEGNAVKWQENTKYRSNNHIWSFGGTIEQKVTSLLIRSDDNGRSINGQITYADQRIPIVFRGRQASTKLRYDFFKTDLWGGRIDSISDALKTAVKDLDNVLLTIGKFSEKELATIINDAGGETIEYLSEQLASMNSKDPEYEPIKEKIKNIVVEPDDDTPPDQQLDNKLTGARAFDLYKNDEYTHLNERLFDLLKKTAVSPNEMVNEAIDYKYQATQLFNIYTMWHDMDAFWDTFQSQAKEAISLFEARQILPPVYWIRECFRQFTTDIEIVQRAIQQRGGNPNVQARTLLMTDKLALMALAPFKRFFSDSADDIIPITYFSEEMHIRRLPYASRFIMVGLGYELTLPKPLDQPANQPRSNSSAQTQPEPFTPFELMAIPHEVGHFIYQHANLANSNAGSLEAHTQSGLLQSKNVKTFQDLSNEKLAKNPYYKWCEEIFADLYGCIIAGPLTALGMLAFLATDDKDHVLEDDGEHPIPMLRIFFISEMLRFLSDEKPNWYDFSEAAKSIDENWTAILERWDYIIEDMDKADGRPIRIRLPSHGDKHEENFINLETALKDVRQIIEVFATEVFDKYTSWPMDKDLSHFRWCTQKGTLSEYINQIKTLTASELIAKAAEHDSLSKREATKSDDNSERNVQKLDVYKQTETFRAIAKRWKDSGPLGLGGH